MSSLVTAIVGPLLSSENNIKKIEIFNVNGSIYL